MIIELARQALAPFQPKPEAKPGEPEQRAEKKPAPVGKDDNKSESKRTKSTPEDEAKPEPEQTAE